MVDKSEGRTSRSGSLDAARCGDENRRSNEGTSPEKMRRRDSTRDWSGKLWTSGSERGLIWREEALFPRLRVSPSPHAPFPSFPCPFSRGPVQLTTENANGGHGSSPTLLFLPRCQQDRPPLVTQPRNGPSGYPIAAVLRCKHFPVDQRRISAVPCLSEYLTSLEIVRRILLQLDY